MIDSMFFTKDPVTLLGAGAASVADLRSAIALAPQVLAADGGAALAIRMGVNLDCVIGDMDSLDQELRSQIPASKVFHVAEQDSTDFEKVLSKVRAPMILGVGFTGGRLDHELAVLHGLLRFCAQKCLLLAQHEIIFLCPRKITLPLCVGDTVSLFPLRPVSGRSEGLQWPIDGLQMAPGEQIGTSNKAATADITLEMNAPGMICLVPKSRLAGVMQAVLDSPPWNAQPPAL